MADPAVLDLGGLATGLKTSVLTGRDRGLAARARYGLAELDASPDPVTVVVPDGIKAVSAAFFCGLFLDSLDKLRTEEQFVRKYRFEASDTVMLQIRSSLKNALARALDTQ